MALISKTTIEIRQVANGYLVMPAESYERRVSSIGDDDRLVFQTFAGLASWIEKHFTHRSGQVSADSPW